MQVTITGRRQWKTTLIMFVTAVLLCSSSARAQLLYGTITGNIIDSTGAALPGVTVQARNTGTGVVKNAVTDERGTFVFSDLVSGVYDVSFELSGFRTLSQRGIRVDSNNVRRVDGTLDVSPVSERVDVVAGAVILQTEHADIHITQTAKQVNELPLVGSLGRNYQSLMQVVPGAVIMRTENGKGEANSTAGSPQRSISFSANGVSGWQNQTRIDGSPVQYVWLPTNTAYVPSPEAIEEVSIVTNSYTAEMGMSGGAAINGLEGMGRPSTVGSQHTTGSLADGSSLPGWEVKSSTSANSCGGAAKGKGCGRGDLGARPPRLAGTLSPFWGGVSAQRSKRPLSRPPCKIIMGEFLNRV